MASNRTGPEDSPSADWQAAVAAQQRGALPEAIALYRKIIEAKPEHADAYANLASCLRASGDLTAALTLLGKAVTLQPERADILFNLGNAQRMAGDLRGAAETFRKAVGAQPRLGPAWLNLGIVLRKLERDAEALKALDRAAELLPKMAQAHSERGSLLRKLDRLEEAVASHRQAVALARDDPEAAYNLANALAAQGERHEAAALYRRVVDKRPDFAQALINLAELTPLDAERTALTESVALLERALAADPGSLAASLGLARRLEAVGRWSDAHAHYRAAAEIAPDNSAPLRALAQACQRQGDAAEATALLTRALGCDPDSVSLLAEWSMALRAAGRGEEARERLESAVAGAADNAILRRCLGILHVDAERMDDAIAQLEVALRLSPDDSQAHMAMANALLAIGRLSEAQEHAERVLALDPKSAGAHSFMGFALAQRGELAQAMASFGRAADGDERPDSHLSNLLFVANYREDLTGEQVAALHRRFGQAVRESHLPPAELDRDPQRRLRVGYLSPDFREHSVSAFFEPLLAAHDPATVETVCYAVVPKPDAVTERLKRNASSWRDIDGLAAREAAELIRRDRIDILVDLAGHTARNRLRVFACKPAPIQATYIGYPNSTGLAEVDYRLTDAVADPTGKDDAHYTETLLRLPRCFLAYGAPPDAPAVQSLPAAAAGHVTFGSFNALPKLTPGTAKLWSGVLHAVPGSRLLLKAPSFADPETRERISELFTAEGIEVSRLELLTYTRDRMEHLGLYGRIDIGLDPFPYNGTTTTCEAMWMGVPVVTLRGAHHAGRVGASLLSAAGLEELIAESLDDYVDKAAALAGNLPRLSALRHGLRRRMADSSLCDAGGLARALESAYRDMWRHYLAAPGGSTASDAAPAEREPDYQRLLGLMATDFAAAEAQIEAAVQRWPDSFRAQVTLGFVRNFRKDHAGAVAALERAVTIEPSSAVARFNLGYCLERLGQLDAALTHYQGAAALSGGGAAESATQAAACLHRLGRIEESVATYAEVLKPQPDRAAALFGLMQARREQGQSDKAEDASARLRALLSEQPARAGELVAWLNRYDFHGWGSLDDKAALVEQVSALRAARGKSAFPFLPQSFVLPGQKQELVAAHKPGDVWILKPAALFGGQGVRLIDDPGDLPTGKGWLAQRYIAEPMLLQERKFHLRLYLLVAGVAPPRLALWQDGIARLAVEPYRLEGDALGEIARHVTNSVRFRDHPGMRLSSDPDREDEGNVWSLGAVLRSIAATQAERERLQEGLLELGKAVAELIGHAGLLDAQCQGGLRFAYPPKLLGLDVLLDQSSRPWLLEIEAFPALDGGGAAVVRKLHDRLFQSVAAIAAAPDSEESDLGPDWSVIAMDRWAESS